MPIGTDASIAMASFQYVTLDPPGSVSASVQALNDSGQVVGEYTAGAAKMVIIDDDGKYASFEAPGANFTYPVAINGLRQIAGFNLGSAGSHGVFASPSDLPTVGGLTADPLPGAVAGSGVHTSIAAQASGTLVVFGNVSGSDPPLYVVPHR